MHNNSIIPFWGWNDRLEKEELIKQITEMKAVGIDGFFMHARGGLITDYMGEEWFEMIQCCLDKASELDMQGWVYDENGWPSGFGDGKVPAVCEEYQQKWLECKTVVDPAVLPEHVIGFYRLSDKGVFRVEQPLSGDLVIFYDINRYYIDPFNQKAVRCFIDNTHQIYYQRMPERFGSELQGFFTDEPQYGNSGKVPWSHLFEAKFLKRYGYSLTDELASLYCSGETSAHFRSDYYNMVSDLFRHSFIKQMYDWCTAHNCKLTGHMMNEDSLYSQMSSTAGVMPCYEYFHEPAVDWLGREIGNSPLTPKQLGSAAAQLGKKTRTETFALCGWDVTLNELKQNAQWQYVNGVTSLCPHIEEYSIRGYRKRDYPASIFTQLPWFHRAYGFFSNYFTRLGELLDSGTEYAPLLMIHPLQSAYIAYNPLDLSELEKTENSFKDIIQYLSDQHILHHYGDEVIMQRYGRTEKNTLIVGKCKYQAVLLPDLINIRQSTLELLLEFVENGGRLFYIGSFPKYADGQDNADLKRLYEYAEVWDYNSITSNSSGVVVVSVQTNGCENGSIHCTVRKLKDGSFIYYLVNLSDRQQEACVVTEGRLYLTDYDVVNCKETALECEHLQGKTVVSLCFAPYGSYVLKSVDKPFEAKRLLKEYIALDRRFEVTACTENCLTLDKCEYRIDGEEWQPKKAIILLQEELLARQKSCDIELKFDFTVKSNAALHKLCLCVETPERYSFKINGRPYKFSDIGGFVDKSIRRSSIEDYAVFGKNEIVLKTRFHQSENVYRVLFTPGVHESERNKLTYDTELESVYLTGDFGVFAKGDFSVGERRCIFSGSDFYLSDRVDQVEIDNITIQGYYFFSGLMELSQQIEVQKEESKHYFIKLNQMYCPAAELIVNGKSAGLFAFAPFELEITKLLENGKNQITIRLMSGNRNLLGPHHRPYGESYFVGPATFTDQPGWTDIGKEGWTENYSFVLFGAELHLCS